MKPLKLLTAHEELLRAALRGPLTEEDALVWMALIHTHEIGLRGTVIEDAPQRRMLSAATLRHAATVVASLWPEKDDRRGRYEYWYRQYQLRTPYETDGQMPTEHAQRLRALREALLEDPRVETVTEERPA